MYLNEIAPTATAPATPSWLTNITGALPALVQLQQMRQVQKINAARLSQGLAPIDASAMGAQVKVGMDTGQLNKIMAVGSIALAAVLAVYLLSRRK